ncbi:tetratricopeptide repeat-containing response regulator [Pseudoalteromonas tunicata]|uniref:tetratricopeptide repeat-containing response regulator n=1 Tax=Pseudoalteromonas tunicata TaxID=314281 RepID=UPI00273E0C19|nr:tetratricopeptide repeat-containing response regulator [Pseudoalteromonas tunicata]MDP4983125.1 response regulator [Pseudoalteromonas tunicata]
MTNPLQRYTQLKFLIVDDFSEFRLSLKQMVESFGAKHVDVCINAEEAISKYAEHYHNVILVDYNLGEGLSGLQLLEELNHRELLKPGTIFILITGETAMELVMGALEYRPDDYLAKPFTRNTLKTRLDKLVHLQEVFSPIYQALSKGKPNLAIECCDALQQSSRLTMHCLRLKGDILLKSGSYAKAVNVFTTVIEQHELNWALMGLARAYSGLNKLSEIEQLCKKIITKNKSALEAYDLLAETQCALGEFEEAYSLLKSACEISPNSLIRQRKLGSLAERYLDLEIAYNAFKKVISLGKYSIKIRPDDYLSLLQIIVQIQFGSFGSLSLRAPKEYAGIYRDISRRYLGDFQLALALQLHQALLKYLSNDKDAGLTEIKELLTRCQQLPDRLKPFLIHQITFVEQRIEEPEVKNTINQQFLSNRADLVTQENFNKANNYNRQGMVKFKEKDYLAAKNAFKTALMNSPSNINIALNLLQCLYRLAENHQRNAIEPALLSLCAQSLECVDPADHRFAHSQSLFRNIKAKIAQ